MAEEAPRYVVHYVPTSCSWLNLIERWFAELTTSASAAIPFSVSMTSSPPLRSSSPPGTKIPSHSF